jgi:endonuclease-3 related protein
VKDKIHIIYKRLFSHFGPQHWWPGDTPFEVAVGAILTQNTNWSNVEKAIGNLKKERSLSHSKLHRMPLAKLASLIRPAGYFNIKARRLKNFLNFYFIDYGGRMDKMKKEDAEVIRKKLLTVNGIGPETADSIALYALQKPFFVIDAYTKRVLSRHNIMADDASYEEFQGLFHSMLKRDVKLYNEYHALFVKVGKEYCGTTPACGGCPLKGV